MSIFDSHKGANKDAGATPKPRRRSSAHAADAEDQTLLTRRKFLYGAAGIGAVAAVGIGVNVVRGSHSDEAPTINVGNVEIPVLEVPESATTTLNDLESLESYEGQVQLTGNYELPYGTLIWVNDDSVAACLIPTETGSPLAQIGLFSLGSGTMTVALDKAVGANERFEVYDVRATSSGMIWTEANVLDGAWRIYAAKVSGNSAGTPKLLEEGGSAYETPMLAVSGDRGFWQVLPKAPNPDGLTSRLMGVTFGEDNAQCVYESKRRMGTPPYSAEGSIVISPRVDSPTVYYQLTNIKADSGEILDQLTLPHGMAPLEAGYGETGFTFSFPDIYDYGGGISNLGTYTPKTKPENGNYGKTQWFGFSRTPSAAPAWCKGLFIVKSSYSVCGVDLNAGTYFAIDVDDGADSYGEYLATSGTHDTFVTYTNIDHSPVNAKATHACRVKVWTPLSDSERSAARAQSEQEQGQEQGAEATGAENANGTEAQSQSLEPQTVEIASGNSASSENAQPDNAVLA